METTRIIGLPFPASKIGLGTWAIGGWQWGGTDEPSAIRTIHAALDSDINLIDTAPVYGFGRAEEIVGKAIAQRGGRDRVILATKCGLEWQGERIARNGSPQRVRAEIETSLQRLRTDCIDLYQIHWPDPLTPIAETMGALDKLRMEGKIRAIGVSNFDTAQIEAARRVAPVHAIQSPYNLFERGIERDVLPYAERNGIALLAYGALCRGLLTGRITTDTVFAQDDLRHVDPKFQQPLRADYLSATRTLHRLADIYFDKSGIALALRWILDHPQAIALWGARRPDQLAPVDEAMGWRLDDAARDDIDEILQTAIRQPVGAEFMAPPAGRGTAERLSA